MRIQMKIHITGSRNGRPWPPKGGIVDLPDHEAADLIAAGHAQEVPADEPRPTAPAADDRQAAGTEPDGATEGDAGTAAAGAAPEGLDALDKPTLLTLAAKHGIEVSSRWGAPRLRTVIADTLTGEA